jgi:hypothetical protein
MGAQPRRGQPTLQQPEASGLAADPPPHGPQRVAVVGWGAILPAFPEGEVDVQHGRTVHLQLQVVPGRPAAIPRVDPDRIGVAEMLGVVAAAAGQVDAADEGDAAPGPVGEWTTSSFWWWLPKRRTRWSATSCPPARLTSVLSTRLASWLKRTMAGWERHSSPRIATPRRANPASSGPSSLPGLVSWRVASIRQSVRYTQSPASRPDSSWCSRVK